MRLPVISWHCGIVCDPDRHRRGVQDGLDFSGAVGQLAGQTLPFLFRPFAPGDVLEYGIDSEGKAALAKQTAPRRC